MDQIRALREQGALIPGGNLAFGIVVNRFLKPALTIRGNKNRIRGCLMSRVLGRGNGYELHMIRNVRPAVELRGSSRRTALVMICGILIASAALLLIVLRS